MLWPGGLCERKNLQDGHKKARLKFVGDHQFQRSTLKMELFGHNDQHYEC